MRGIFSASAAVVSILLMLAITSALASTWSAGEGWKVINSESLSVHARAQTAAWNKTTRLQKTWSVSADVHIQNLFKGAASARFVFGRTIGKASLIITLQRLKSQNLTAISVDILNGTWRNILASGWLPGEDTTYSIKTSFSGDSITVHVYGNRGLTYLEKTPEIPLNLGDSLSVYGLAAIDADVDFLHLKLQSPIHESNRYISQANSAMRELIGHYWQGGPDDGDIQPTYNGYPIAGQPDDRGGMWERSILVFDIDTLYRATGDSLLRRRLAAEWNWTKRQYTSRELQAAGSGVHPACDDTGWDALQYLTFYHDLGDPYALKMAAGLVNNGFNRWLTNDLGGGLWYSDARQVKSLYQTAIVLSALRIWKATRNKTFYDRAKSCYSWMESHLLRKDGLYWCDRNIDGPIGKNRPNDIRHAGSVTFLGGDMAMAVLHAWFFRATGNPKYLYRAKRTVDAINAKLVRDGSYFDDRDAWTNGSFAGEWAKYVCTLPGFHSKQYMPLLHTADSIYKYDQTDGYFGACWHGPADGSGSPWSVIGSRPQQIMTSSSSANFIMAAALLSKLIHDQTGESIH